MKIRYTIKPAPKDYKLTSPTGSTILFSTVLCVWEDEKIENWTEHFKIEPIYEDKLDSEQ